jgi:hypothetical protein
MLKPSVLPVVSSHSIPYSASLYLMAGELLINFAVSIQTPPWDPPLPVLLAGHIVLSQPALGTCLRAVLSRAPASCCVRRSFLQAFGQDADFATTIALAAPVREQGWTPLHEAINGMRRALQCVPQSCETSHMIWA